MTTCASYAWWYYTPSAPAQGDGWYDLEDIVEGVLERLRLQESDIDEARIRQLIPVAAGQINTELDRVYEMTPAGTADTGDVDEDADITELLETNVTPGIIDALKRLTIELYRRGRTDRNGNVAVEIGSPIDAVIDDLAGAKSRWGIA